MKALRWRWQDTGLVCVLTVMAAIGSFTASGRLPQPVLEQESCVNFWFEGDLPYVYNAMLDARNVHHRRSNRHPLFSLASYLPTKALRAMGVERSVAVRVVVSVVATLSLGALFLTLRCMGCRSLDATLFSLLAAVSAGAMFWFTVPETWSFGALTLLLALLVVAWDAPRTLSLGWYVIASAATLSMTLTNWMAGIFMTFLRFPWRRALQVTVLAFAIVAALWAVEKPLFPATQFLPQRQYIAASVLQQDSGGSLAIIRANLLHTMVMPMIGERVRDKDRGGVQMSVQRAGAGSASPWGRLAVWLWGALLVLGAWGAVTLRPQRPLTLVVGLTLLGQLALHQVYGGEESFLYAAHFLPLLVVLAAFGTLTRARWVVVALAGALVVCAGMNNAHQFAMATQRLEAYVQARTLGVHP